MSWPIRIFLLAAGFFLAVVLLSIPYLKQISLIERTAQVKINEQIIIAEVVNDERNIRRGLSGRPSLGVNEGMLFVFEEPGTHSFWMKGMRFSIDIIWIRDNVIVGFQERIQPEPGVRESELKMYYPPQPVDKVLELAAGRVRLLRAVVGDEVKVKPIIPL